MPECVHHLLIISVHFPGFISVQEDGLMLELNTRNLVLIVIWLLFHMGVNLLKVVLARSVLLLMSS